jgi:tetratricopeptide (TPR) repeat protein
MTVDEEIAAAYACDRDGRERDAILHYDRAWSLGVPEPQRRHFLVGFGSTLRNVGRADEAVALLTEAIAADPDYPAFRAFLALALHSSGHPKAALATLLGLALDLSPAAFDGYDRALTEYHHELLG